MSDVALPNLNGIGIETVILQDADRTVLIPDVLPEFKVSGLFSSHMVLQHGEEIKVWGWSKRIGAEVKGIWRGEEVCGTVSELGRFEIFFSKKEPSYEPSVMTITLDELSITFDDILTGDVWVIGGQSNAEHTLGPCVHMTNNVFRQIDENMPVRLFRQTQYHAALHTEFHAKASADIIEPDWCWKRPGKAAALDFSAMGYYFAINIYKKINVPLGLVMMAAGGACVRELLPVKIAAELGYTTGANVPCGGYYNTLIAPLIGLKFRGQMFYQGESEGIWKEMAESYDKDLAVLVADERRRFGFDFPFYNVQLTSYRDEGGVFFPHLRVVRSRQFSARDIIPKYELVVNRDQGAVIGDVEWAHSPRKSELGKRLANLILAKEYGVGEYDKVNSPMPVLAKLSGDKIEVKFDYVAGGLVTADGFPVSGYEVITNDGTEIPATAKIISADTVSVDIPGGIDPNNISAVGYAMDSKAYIEQANLFGGNRLPAPSAITRLS